MATLRRQISASPERVFAVLSDPFQYAKWVVGAKTVRGVEGDWPSPGATFFHKIGTGPAEVADSSSVLEVEADRQLVLRVRARPFGTGTVRLTLRPSGEGTEVEMDEVVHQPVLLRLAQPLLDPLVAARNRKSLDRLAALSEATDG